MHRRSHNKKFAGINSIIKEINLKKQIQKTFHNEQDNLILLELRSSKKINRKKNYI